MHRVLKPGGVAALATEFRLTGDPPGFPGTYFFNEEELRSVVMDGLDWELASPLELVPADVASIPISDLIPDAPPPIPPNLRKRIAARIEGKTVEWEQQPAPPTLPTPYPHILVHHKGYQWTSVHVALVKPGSADPSGTETPVSAASSAHAWSIITAR